MKKATDFKIGDTTYSMSFDIRSLASMERSLGRSIFSIFAGTLKDVLAGMEIDVLAAAVNLDTIAAVGRNGSQQIRVLSQGYPLCTVSLEELTPDPAERVALLRGKLDRPIRVCGMVKNEGEPGGGPFIIAGKDGSSNLQILESVQINPEDARSKDILAHATHFNPVDLVCCLKNYKGEKFDLLKYVDEDAGFISSKSYQGRELKALELPGLWNGSMSEWNTMFVEVPLETFNPVKVVLDLLRPAHQ